MNDKKVIYIDLETGGPDPRNTCLLQLSGIIEINWEVKERFNVFLKPFPNDPPIEEQASEKHGITQAIIDADVNGEKFKDPSVVFNNFKTLLNKYVDPYNKADKFTFVGYNCHGFDDPCLREFFKKNDDKYYGSHFWYPTIDVMLLYMGDWWSIRDNFPNFQLATVAKLAGLQFDEGQAHDGLYDVTITRDLWIGREKQQQNMRRVFAQVHQKAVENQQKIDATKTANDPTPENVPPKESMN